MLEDRENPNNLSPTTFAILNNLYDMADLLKENGANIFAPAKDDNSILHFAC